MKQSTDMLVLQIDEIEDQLDGPPIPPCWSYGGKFTNYEHVSDTDGRKFLLGGLKAEINYHGIISMD